MTRTTASTRIRHSSLQKCPIHIKAWARSDRVACPCSAIPMRLPAAYPLSALLAWGATVSAHVLLSRQSEVCPTNNGTCFGNGQPCSTECICIDPFNTGGGECVPSTCIGVRCASADDCCASPLPFVCLIPPGVSGLGICAPSLPPGELPE
ncbi:hypothetical protein C8Q79DRAFT_988016 [Trametes meyenii]|nr:hypothetical protein C8Q79DRAFT_988016 [Trametes meyenii]